ncbi:MAG TPA: pyridoxal-dependent decarboxylase [Pirellulales bacterium]|nr:pyridoxal-dependent decarboxylase [Pirellulales bacterium]
MRIAVHYQELLEKLRLAFPQPVSDPVHDGYVVFSILRALDQVDALKSQAPILGVPTEPDYERARRERVDDQGRALEAVIPELVSYLQGMFIWGHPRSQINVVPNPSIAGIVGVLLPLIYNPNLCSDEGGRRFSEAEVRATAMAAELVGYDPALAGGVFTFGGTGGILYGVKVGLEKALPGSSRGGLKDDAVILASQQSHYSCLNVASWLGIGQDNVIAVPTHWNNSIQIPALEQAAREALSAGKKIAAIVATMGSTDAFGIDDLRSIAAVRQRLAEQFSLAYLPHIHADAVIGWAWSVFNDYDFSHNPLGFRGRTVRALAAAQHDIQHLRLADSIGIDFHKTGYTPYISSLVLFGDSRDFDRIARSRETMPYLYTSGSCHPGMYTLETTRGGVGPMAALANLLMFGKQGYRVLLGHAVEMAEVLREMIESHPNLTVLNGENVGAVTLFRAYPDGVDTFGVKSRERSEAGYREQLLAYNDYNRKIFERVHAEALAGAGVAISLTSCYRQTDFGDPIVALKSYVLSPFSDERRMESIVKHVLRAREAVDRESTANPPS